MLLAYFIQMRVWRAEQSAIPQSTHINANLQLDTFQASITTFGKHILMYNQI